MDIQTRISQQSDQYVARRVAMHVLEMSQEQLIVQRGKQLSTVSKATMDHMMDQHLSQKVPLAYVLGYEMFCGQRFMVDERVLIPRAETEELVMRASKKIYEWGEPTLILDMGTGSGCIGISVMDQIEQLGGTRSIDCVLCDISTDALEVAKTNATRLLTQHLPSTRHIDVMQLSDDDQSLDVFWEEKKYIVILANLPYIPEGYVGVEDDVAMREPSLALYSGDDGLDHYRALVAWAARHRGDQSWVLWMEMMSDQASILAGFSDMSPDQWTTHQTFHPNIVIVELAIPSLRE